MKSIWHYLLAFTLAAAALSVGISITTAQSPVKAEVDRESLALGETLNLTIVIDGSQSKEPEIPIMDGFQVVSSGKSSQFSMINGKMSAQVSYHYTLRPTREGNLTIPEISVTVDGQVYTTQPIEIEVQAAANPLQPVQPIQPGSTISPDDLNPGMAGEDAFVEASVDNHNPYVGEQVLYTFRFFRAVSFFEQPSYQPPNFQGFWSEEDTQQHDYDVQISGRHYRVVELQRVLIPTAAGDFTIEPARLSIPGSFFTSDVELATEPIEINVGNLPEPAPEGFHGAVGNFSISTDVDKEQVVVNDPVTLQVEITGEGNLNTLSEVEMPVIESWRVFDATTKNESDVEDGKLRGSWVSEQLMVPNEAGEFEIPAVTFVYFDPQAEEFQTLRTEAIPIKVKPGSQDAQAAGSIEKPFDTGEQASGETGNELRYIKVVPESLKKGSREWFASPIYWILAAGAPIVLVIDWMLRRRKKYLLENPERVRASKASKKALRALEGIDSESSITVQNIDHVLRTYLDERLNRSVRGMRNEELLQFLGEHGISKELAAETMEILRWSEMERYGAVRMDMEQKEEMAGRASVLIKLIEDDLKEKNM